MVDRTLGHYHIEAELGAGGMGVVYRARDTRLERRVALKFVGERQAADAGARERLLREARAASALNHPHICHIYEVGEAEGRAYIAMELVEGRPLSQSIPPEGMPVEAVLRTGGQVADALAHAHERGVVHRDLKSANVVVTPEGRAKVLDFGLAERLRPEQLAEATRSRAALTEEHALAGTLAYMAPERLRGEPADARSDLWALGVLLYEMATGKLPFEGQTGFELSSRILREAPAPLGARAPAGLRAIIQRLLAKEPGQRYQRAGEVLAALEALQSDTVVAVVAAGKARSRPRWLAAMLWPLVAVLLLLTAAIVVATIKGVPVSVFVGITKIETPGGPRLSTGGKPSANAEADEYFEKAMLFGLARLDPPRMREMLERSLELDPHFAEARAWYGFTYLLMIDSGSSNDTSVLYRAEEEVRRALADDPDCARAHSVLASIHLIGGRKELVAGEVEKALELNPKDVDAKLWLAAVHTLNEEYEASEKLIRQVMETAPTFWPVRLQLGLMHLSRGDGASAVRDYEKILEQDPQNLFALQEMAYAYMVLGELPAARRALERLRPTDRQSHRVRVREALLLALEGKQSEAQGMMDAQALKYAGFIVWVTIHVAEFYAVRGEKEKALEWLDRAVRNGDERGEWFERDPLLANIREEPRFKQILESIAYRRQQRGPAAAPAAGR